MVSIIVPIYKVEQYLPKCIESLIVQTYHDIEVILVDDGSPDGCPQICEDYAKKDERIVVLHQQNQGVSAARNAGLQSAKGEFIGFVDPDDWVSPDMYEGMVNALVRMGADLAICGYDYYNESGEVDEKRKYPIRPDETVSQKEVMKRFSDMPPSIRHGVWNKLFRNNLLHDIGFKEGLHSSEDVFFLTEYVCGIENAVIVHQPYYKNLVRQGSATHGGLSIKSLAESFEAHDYMYRETVKRYPDLKDHSLAFLMDACLLKYNAALNRKENGDQENRSYLKIMRSYIRKHSLQAAFDREIYWKTRLYYLLLI